MKKIISVILASIMLFALMLPAFAVESICTKLGDIDDSGVVDISDARSVLRFAIKLDTPDENKTLRSDLDNNGTVDISDARSVLRIAIKLDSQPVHEGAAITDPANSEFNALNSESYVISGRMVERDGTETAMFLAKKGENMYMQSEMEGIKIGMLIKDGKLYMLTSDRKNSLELNDKVCKSFGMTDEDIASMTSVSDIAMDFPPLSEAQAAVMIGTETCPVCGEIIPAGMKYTFIAEDHSRSDVYMTGNKLEKIVSISAFGNVISTTYFDYAKTEVDDSYFSLPKSKLNQYNTAAGAWTFMLKLAPELL